MQMMRGDGRDSMRAAMAALEREARIMEAHGAVGILDLASRWVYDVHVGDRSDHQELESGTAGKQFGPLDGS